jgi:hypothetical protein
MSDLEPMDAELARLFEEERASQVPEPIARREVLARVEKSLLLATLAAGAVQGAATGAGASAAATGLTSNLAKLKIALLLGAAGTFAAGVAVGRSTAPSPTPAPVASTPVAMVTPASEAASASASSSPPVASTSAKPSAAPSSEVLPTATSAAPSISASAAPAASDDLPKEQALLDTARAALARGRADDALAAVASHASTFPRGRLVEDREALAVQAHAAAGHADDARKRAERFRTRYPKSIYLPAIDRALARL